MTPPAGRLKVVHLITLLELGGAQGNTIHTVRNLDPLRFDARLWCGRGAYWDADVQRDLGAEGRLRFFSRLVRPVHPLFDLLAIFDLWRAFRQEKPDVVHTHSSKAGILGRIAAHLAGVPVVVHTFHGFGFNDRQRALVRALYIRLEEWTARFAQALIFVSIANREEARELEIGEESRYRLIRSGVPLKRLSEIKGSVDRAKVRSALDLPANARVVTTLSAFKPQKNLIDFVRLAEAVVKESPDAAFVLIGDGEQRPELERLVAEKGLSGRFRMPGWRRDASEILAASDVFVLTSLWEGLPRALVEASALGIPSLCYDTDGVRDLLSVEAGEILPRGNVEGLTKSVERLLNDVFVAQAMAEAQASRITGEFDINHMVRQQERLYLQLWDAAAQRRPPVVDKSGRKN